MVSINAVETCRNVDMNMFISFPATIINARNESLASRYVYCTIPAEKTTMQPRASTGNSSEFVAAFRKAS